VTEAEAFSPIPVRHAPRPAALQQEEREICGLSCAEITSQIWALRRPSGKARKRRNMDLFRGLATPPGGMHRRPKREVVFAWALSGDRQQQTPREPDRHCGRKAIEDWMGNGHVQPELVSGISSRPPAGIMLIQHPGRFTAVTRTDPSNRAPNFAARGFLPRQ